MKFRPNVDLWGPSRKMDPSCSASCCRLTANALCIILDVCVAGNTSGLNSLGLRIISQPLICDRYKLKYFVRRPEQNWNKILQRPSKRGSSNGNGYIVGGYKYSQF